MGRRPGARAWHAIDLPSPILIFYGNVVASILDGRHVAAMALRDDSKRKRSVKERGSGFG